MTVAPFRLSQHAMERALQMGVLGEEIREAFDRPRSIRPAGMDEYYTRGRVTLVIARTQYGELVVKTILWGRPSDWAADKEIGGYDRDFYMDSSRRWRKSGRGRS